MDANDIAASVASSFAEPRPSPDGRLVAYRNRSALHVSELSPPSGSGSETFESGRPLLDSNPPPLPGVTVSAGTEYGDGCYAWIPGEKYRIAFSSQGKLHTATLGTAPQFWEGCAVAGPFGPSDGLCYNIVLLEDDTCMCACEGPAGMAVWRGRLERPGEEGWVDVTARICTPHTFVYDATSSQDGSMLAGIGWSPPNMMWTGSRVYINGAPIQPGEQANMEISPQFCPSNYPKRAQWISFLSEGAGWLNIWIRGPGGAVRCLYKEEAEVAWSSWSSDAPGYAWVDDSHIVYARSCHGLAEVRVLVLQWPVESDPEDDGPTVVESKVIRNILNENPTGMYSDLRRVPGQAACVCTYSSWNVPSSILYISLADGTAAPVTLCKGAYSGTLSEPRHFQCSNGDAAIHALIYRPADERESDPPRPSPLVVSVHGGPTGISGAAFAPLVQFLATRGWMVATPNYRGSKGAGRAYREALNGNWGVFDVSDCATVAEALIRDGVADPGRVVVMGGSAGGYTTLLSLQQRPDLYSAGIAMCPVTSLEGLSANSHLLERHYNDTLIGPQDHVATASTLKDRSPLIHAASVGSPLLLLHGEDDTVVPAEQSRQLLEGMPPALRRESCFYKGKRHMFLDGETLPDILSRIASFLNL